MGGGADDANFNASTSLYGLYPALTSEQLRKVAELKHRTDQDTMPPSFVEWIRVRPQFFYTRYLYARDWNLDKATAMLRDSAAFRLSERLEETALFPSVKWTRGFDQRELERHMGRGPRAQHTRLDAIATALNGLCCSSWHYWDKEGRPVLIERTGETRPVEFMQRCRRLARPSEKATLPFVLMDTHNNEVGGALVDYVNKSQGRDKGPGFLSQVTVVLDTKGLSWAHFGRAAFDLFKDSAEVSAAFYPEGLAAVYVVNAPSLLTSGYKLLKPFIDKRTQHKVQILGPGKATEDALKAAIDEERLPTFLGGQCACPGGCVPSLVDGTAVDRWDEVDKRFLTRSTSVKAKMAVTETFELFGNEPRRLRWSLAPESYDVAYTVTLHSSDRSESTSLGVGQEAKFASDAFVIPSEYKCTMTNPCSMELHFNNRTSRINGKTVHWRVEPDGCTL